MSMNHINVVMYTLLGAVAAFLASWLGSYFRFTSRYRFSIPLSIGLGMVFVFTRAGAWFWSLLDISMPSGLLPPDFDNPQLDVLFVGWTVGVLLVMATRAFAVLKLGA